MVANDYVPERGDIVWVDFNPTIGHEQSNRRPAIILSSRVYNIKTGLILTCPVTSVIKGYPFEILLVKCKTKGTVLSNQVRALDWRARNIKFIERSNTALASQVVEVLESILKE